MISKVDVVSSAIGCCAAGVILHLGAEMLLGAIALASALIICSIIREWATKR